LNDTISSLGAITTQEILEELDCAISEQMVWLKNWHRELVCADTPTPKELAYDPHHLGRFGSWYVKNQHKGLVNQPVIRNLANLHRDMHEKARKLMEGARRGMPLPGGDYDGFMDAAADFVAQARRLEKAFATASSHLDPLTGLHNRQAMGEELKREQERFLRTGQPCCIALGDLDHFKKINDTYGHGAGDKVLLSSADSFLSQLRPYDSLYRYGGEEFLFCLPDADLKTAHNVLDRLRQELESRTIKLDSEEELSVSASFGIAEMTAQTAIEETIERADQALYWAKRQGRNRVCGWSGPEEVDALAGEDY
tara:strand:- start:407 stop:1339 length:933 start_codon:yes stop_codon:yes gene_type:complete